MIDRYTIASLENDLEWIKKNLELNHVDIENVDFVIKKDWHRYRPFDVRLCFGKEPFVEMEFDETDEIINEAPDSRPENGGEYWKSRGCGIGRDGFPDCSGFVVSKKAGERISRMVKYILENDNPDSFLDYRESEPNYIQYKFSGIEFDVKKLSKLSKENDGIITEAMLRECANNLKKIEFLKSLNYYGYSDYEEMDDDCIVEEEIDCILKCLIGNDGDWDPISFTDDDIFKFITWVIVKTKKEIASDFLKEIENDNPVIREHISKIERNN